MKRLIIRIVRQTYSHYETANGFRDRKCSINWHISIDDLMHLTVDLDKNIYYGAPMPTQTSNELAEFLEYFSNPEQEKNISFLHPWKKKCCIILVKLMRKIRRRS